MVSGENGVALRTLKKEESMVVVHLTSKTTKPEKKRTRAINGNRRPINTLIFSVSLTSNCITELNNNLSLF